jgi:hypothetical protein
MANLQATTVNGNFTANSGKVFDSGSAFTPWYKLSHCDCSSDPTGNSDCLGTGHPYLHVRTPIPADNTHSGIGWIPMMFEVVGYHTYSGERFHNHKWVVNIRGDNNGFSATQLSNQNNVNDAGNSIGWTGYNLYRSASSYGSKKRVVLVVPKVNCCCTGFLWVRWSVTQQYRNDHAWATQHFNSTTVGY